MKIAITGKGGVGKTTVSALLCHIYASEGKKVIAVDADPDANLSLALGFPEEEIKNIRPIAEIPELVEERTGAKPGSIGGMFKLNPKVDDIPEGFGFTHDGTTLLIMGKSKHASSGCYCPEHALLKRLLKHLILERDEVVIVDMEAGIEHLTRGTAGGVDVFIVVVEPGKRSLQTAFTVKDLASELGVERVFAIANKVRNDKDLQFIKDSLGKIEVLGMIGFSESIMEADINGVPAYKSSEQTLKDAINIKEKIENSI